MLYKDVLPKFYEYIKINRNQKFNNAARYLFENLKTNMNQIVEFKHISPDDLKRAITSASRQLKNYYGTQDIDYERKINTLYQKTLGFANNYPHLAKLDEKGNQMFLINHYIRMYANIENITNKQFKILDTLSYKLNNFDFLDANKETLYSLIHNFTFYKHKPDTITIEKSREFFNYIANAFFEFMDTNLAEVTRRMENECKATIEELLNM
ncbi:MAG TPA: hypothetical protein PLR26_03940 [Bacilli bacterium]|nr:hypothetical protein [Bacilli bacterium]